MRTRTLWFDCRSWTGRRNFCAAFLDNAFLAFQVRLSSVLNQNHLFLLINIFNKRQKTFACSFFDRNFFWIIYGQKECDNEAVFKISGASSAVGCQSFLDFELDLSSKACLLITSYIFWFNNANFVFNYELNAFQIFYGVMNFYSCKSNSAKNVFIK